MIKYFNTNFGFFDRASPIGMNLNSSYVRELDNPAFKYLRAYF